MTDSRRCSDVGLRVHERQGGRGPAQCAGLTQSLHHRHRPHHHHRRHRRRLRVNASSPAELSLGSRSACQLGWFYRHVGI